MTPEEQAAHVETALVEMLERCALGLTGDSARDLEHVSAFREGQVLFLAGESGETVRLFLGLRFHSEEEVEIALIVTKGDQDVRNLDWGDTGPEIGNTPLFARVVHVAIREAQQLGIRRLKNTPATPRLRAKYRDLGFVDDDPLDDRSPQTLDLENEAAVGLAIAVVRSVYDAYDIPFIDPP